MTENLHPPPPACLEPRLAALPFGLFSGPATTSTRAMLVLSDMPRASCKIGHRVQLSPYKRDLLSTAPRPSARPREHKSVPQPEPTPSSSAPRDTTSPFRDLLSVSSVLLYFTRRFFCEGGKLPILVQRARRGGTNRSWRPREK